MAISVRKLALATAAALALFAMSSTEVAAQATVAPTQINTVPNTLPPVDPATKAATIAKLKRVVTVAGDTKGQELPEACNIRIIAFSQALLKYSRDPVLQHVLINVSEDTLMNYAHFVNCTDKTDAKIRVVNSADEDRLRTLMVANGVIPNTETAYGPAYGPQRRTPQTKGSPALKDAPKK